MLIQKKKEIVFSDLDATFQKHPVTKDISLRVDEQAVKFALKNIILTSNWERPFHSEVGTPIKRMLFENITSTFDIILKQVITDAITIYEPRVNILDIIVAASPDNNSVYITIKFNIKNTVRDLTLDLTLKRTR